MSPAARPVLIAGAGPVGMTVALGLADRGIPSVVLEKRGMDGSRETIFNLPPAALQSLAANPSTRDVLSSISPLTEVEVVDTERGARNTIEGPRFQANELGTAVPANAAGVFATARRLGSEPWGSIRIRDFENALRRIAQEKHPDLVEIRTGAEVVGVEQSPDSDRVLARIRSPQGTTDAVEGAFLVAANGASDLIGSPMRRVPEQVHYVGQAARAVDGDAASNTILRHRTEDGVRHMDMHLRNPAGSMVWAQVPDDPSGLDDDAVSAVVRERAAALGAEDQLDERAPLRRVSMQVGRTDTAVNGRILAVGDANRRPYFVTSTGATTGISVDAPRAVLAIEQALSGAVDHRDAFAAYDRAVQRANDVFVSESHTRMLDELDQPADSAALPAAAPT